MESQFGIANVWIQGDFVTRAVAILLLAMSLASWIVILIKALDIIKFKKHARAAQDFWHSEDFAAGLTKLGADPTNPFRHLALEGREATAHHRNTKAHLHDSLDVSDWVTRCLRNCIDEFTARLSSGLAILASVGSTAPFIGLFGTVWGIYHALLAIGTSGQSTIDKVAGPIGEALIMTALGLAVAIPAVLGYNALVRGNKSILNGLNSFAHDLHAYFVTGARVNADDTDDVMNEINMTPLVDVMLVLLIIFIITVPVMKHAVNVDLPRATNQPENVKPETVRLSVSADGKFFWNESQVSEEELFPRLQAEAAKEPQPDLHIRGDKNVRYEFVAQAMAAAQRAGVRKIGFVTDPQGQ
eukprot:gene4167-4217_t